MYPVIRHCSRFLPLGVLVAPLALLTGCHHGQSGASSDPSPVPSTYTVGGTITGLTGTGLVIQNGAATQTINANTASYSFSSLTSGTSYSISVATQPNTPKQICTVANASGTVASANVTNVNITCVVDTSVGPAGGTVTATDGASVVIPANALTSNVDIAIALSPTDAPALPTGVTSIGATYAFTPHGTAFATPVTVSIPFDTNLLPSGQTPTLYKAEVGGSFQPISAVVSGNVLTAQVTNFSFIVPGYSDASTLQFNALSHTCGRQTLTGQLYCWGDITDLTSASLQTISVPASVAGGRAFGQFSASRSAVCGISGIDTWCAGYNYSGMLGDGTTTDSATGVKVQTTAGIYFGSVSVSGSFACGLVQASSPTLDGSVYCWGDNLLGQLGNGTAGSGTVHYTPAPIASTYRYATVKTGGSFACAVRVTGEVDCWGDNYYGEMGRASTSTPQATPAPVPGLQLIIASNALTVGSAHSCGIKANGDSVCWGYNFNGQLGDGTKGSGNQNDPNEYKAPVVVVGGHSFTKLQADVNGTCGILANNDTYCWGTFPVSATPALTPALVGLPTKFIELSGTGDGFCGIAVTDNKTYCWGGNRNGELGSGATTPASSVTPIVIARQ